MNTPSAPAPATPWWKLPIVWLVIGGPSLVVVASFVTLGLAISHPDPVLDTHVAAQNDRGAQPAIQARNHAATPAR